MTLPQYTKVADWLLGSTCLQCVLGHSLHWIPIKELHCDVSKNLYFFHPNLKHKQTIVRKALFNWLSNSWDHSVYGTLVSPVWSFSVAVITVRIFLLNTESMFLYSRKVWVHPGLSSLVSCLFILLVQCGYCSFFFVTIAKLIHQLLLSMKRDEEVVWL